MAKAVKQFKPSEEFAVSDVVVLKSGGPKMIVGKIDQWGLHCTWFSDEKRLMAASFPPESLKKG